MTKKTKCDNSDRRLSHSFSSRLNNQGERRVTFYIPDEYHQRDRSERKRESPAFRLQTATLVLENLHPDDKTELIDSYPRDSFFKNLIVSVS